MSTLCGCRIPASNTTGNGYPQGVWTFSSEMDYILHSEDPDASSSGKWCSAYPAIDNSLRRLGFVLTGPLTDPVSQELHAAINHPSFNAQLCQDSVREYARALRGEGILNRNSTTSTDLLDVISFCIMHEINHAETSAPEVNFFYENPIPPI